jgi:DNA-binding GntR family transcriptional regulator
MSQFPEDPPESKIADAGTPLADAILAKLLERIYDGRLPQGAPMNEAAIAQEFGVSRGPVREAVRRLQGVQLVTREPYLKARVITLTQEDARELFEMRMALEGLACRLAAERMSDEEIEDMVRAFEQERERVAGGTDSVGNAKPFDLHERIVRASRNSRIVGTLCGDLNHLMRMYRLHSGAVPERKSHAFAEHWQIVRALKARDGELAESLMRSHVARASEHLLGTVQAAPPAIRTLPAAMITVPVSLSLSQRHQSKRA